MIMHLHNFFDNLTRIVTHLMTEVDSEWEVSYIAKIAIRTLGISSISVMILIIVLSVIIPMNYVMVVYLVAVIILPLCIFYILSVLLRKALMFSKEWEDNVVNLMDWCILVTIPNIIMGGFFIGELCGARYATI